MQKDQFENTLTIATLIAQTKPRHHAVTISRNVSKLQRLSVSLRKRYEAACSYQWACTEKYERATEKLEAKASALMAELGIGGRHQRDPRGCALYVDINGCEYPIF